MKASSSLVLLLLVAGCASEPHTCLLPPPGQEHTSIVEQLGILECNRETVGEVAEEAADMWANAGPVALYPLVFPHDRGGGMPSCSRVLGDPDERATLEALQRAWPRPQAASWPAASSARRGPTPS